MKNSADVSNPAIARKRAAQKNLTRYTHPEDPTVLAITAKCLLVVALVGALPSLLRLTPSGLIDTLFLSLGKGRAIQLSYAVLNLSASQQTLAVACQVAMLAIAGSVYIFIATTSTSDTMRLRLLLRTSLAQEVVTLLLLWLLTVAAFGIHMRQLSAIFGALLSATAVLRMLAGTIWILLSPRVYSDGYVDLLTQRYACVIAAATACHDADRRFRSWIADNSARLGTRYYPLVDAAHIESCALVLARQTGRIETADTLRLESTLKQLLSSRTDVAPAESGSENISTTDSGSGTPSSGAVFTFFRTPGRDVEPGQVLLAISTSHIPGRVLSLAAARGILRCYTIGDRGRSFAGDVEAEQDALRDRTLHCIDSNLIWEARVARRSYENEFEAFLSTSAQFELPDARATRRGGGSSQELDDFVDALREISDYGCTAVPKAVMRVLVPLPYSLALLSQENRAPDSFRKCCDLMRGQATEMWKTAPMGKESPLHDELRGFDMRMIELLLFGVPSEISQDDDWQEHFSWFVTKTDALLSSFLWLLRSVCTDPKTTRLVVDSLQGATGAYSTPKPSLMTQVPSLDQMYQSKPISVPDASDQLSSFVRGRGTAVRFAVLGFALDSARSQGKPMALSLEHVGLEVLSNSTDFMRAYSTSQSVAEDEFPSWEFWWDDTQEDARMIEASTACAEAAVAVLTLRSISPPSLAFVASHVNGSADDRSRLRELFGENSRLISAIKEAIDGKRGWHEALPQADMCLLKAWVAFASEIRRL